MSNKSVSLPTSCMGCSRSCSRPTFGAGRTQAMDSSNSNYSSNYILPSKRFEICRQLLRSFILSAYARRDCVGLRRFESRLTVTTYKTLALNSSRPTFFVADMVIPFGRYGLFVRPMWSWPIWSVADMVQTLLCYATVACRCQKNTVS